MLRKANNKFFAAIGDNSLTSALPAAGTVVTAANLPEGAIVVTDLGLRRLDDSTAGADLSAMGTKEKFMIVQGMGSSKPLLKSEPITIGNTTITYKSHVVNCQQVSTIGYNGTSGSLPSANDTSYFIKVRKNDNDAANRSQPMSLSAQYKTDGSATQEEVAFGLVSTFKKSITDQEPANGYAIAEVIGDGTVADFTGTATILKFTKGSKTVETYIKAADATSDFTASTASVNDGDIINVPSSGGKSFTFTAVALGAGAGRHLVMIGDTAYNVADAGTAAQNATAIAAAINAGTDASASVATADVTITFKPCVKGPITVLSTNDDSTWAEVAYTIDSGDANETKYRVDGTTSGAATFELDAEFQGETGYHFGGTTVATNTGIATVTNYGVKITGVQADFDVAAERHYYVNRFTPTFSDEDTLVTLIQGAVTGTGMWQQAAMDEYMTWGYEGQNEMISTPPRAREQKMVQCAEYSVVNIAWTENIDTLVTSHGAAGNVLIYCQLNGDGTLPATNASGEVADVVGEIASPVFASTDLDK
jgi:hypothetical protein